MNRVLLCAFVSMIAASYAWSEESANETAKRPLIAFVDMGIVRSAVSLEGETAEVLEKRIRAAIKKFAIRHHVDVVLALDSSAEAESKNVDILLYGGISNFKGYDITGIIIESLNVRRSHVGG